MKDSQKIQIQKKIELSGIFSIVPTMSYPGRIYGMYKWNGKKQNWEIDKDFCKRT